MEELFKGNPAKFPSNNTEEQNSVYKLLDMLDKTYIKPDPKIIDKFPNTDGEITITDQQQYPIGKIELQIKTLPSKDLEKPRYQCDRPFLKHCEISLLPVILIAVNAANNIAYWFHFSREALTELSSKLSGDSITLHIPKENIISYTDKGYIEEWTSIVRRYVARKIDSEKQEYYKAKYEELYNQLKDFPRPVHTIGKENLKQVTLFIDTINNALENEYLSLKEVRYHDFWKLSITYTEFEEDRLSYALVPIRWGENDLLIREAIGLNPFNDFSSASTMFGHYRDNPIKSRPVAYANELLSKQLIEILKDRSLILYTEQLAKECITDFFDYYGRILPIKFDTSVSIAEYLNVAERYLPVWFEEYNKLHHMPIIDCKLLIDVEKLRWHLHPEDVRYITTRVRQRLAKGDDKAPLIKEVGKDMRYHNLLTSLHILKDLGYTNLARPFKAKGQHGDSGLIFDFHTPNSAFEKLKFVYESLPVVYDTFIKEFFPKLFDDLKFYSSCDLVIVNVKYGKIHGSDQESPEIELFYLKSNLSVTPQLKIYLNSQGCPIARENSFIYFDEDITIDGVQYRLNMSSGQDIYKLYDEFTLREIMYELILDKFTRYFKSKTG